MFKNMKTPVAYMTLAMILTLSGCGGQKDMLSGMAETDGGQTGTENVQTVTEEGQGRIREDVIVVMGPSSEPEAGFDPAYGWGAGEHVHEPLIQSTLTVTTTDLKIDYDLATEMKVSDDGMTWTVTIRDGAED